MTLSQRYALTAIASVCFVMGMNQTVAAQILSSPAEMDALFACQTEPDDVARLACFDQAATALQSANASGEVVAISRDDVENVERDAFGFNFPSLPRLRGLLGNNRANDDAENSVEGESAETPSNTDAIDRVMVEVDRWDKTNRGWYRFHLTNGQVWVQTESDSISRPKKDENGVLNVEIRKSRFGSFLLRVNGKGRSIRVRRVE